MQYLFYSIGRSFEHLNSYLAGRSGLWRQRSIFAEARRIQLRP